MHKRKYILIVSLLILIISAVLLITGSSVLMVAVVENPYLPLGNIIAWAGIMALPSAIYFGIGSLNKPILVFEKIIKYILITIIILAVLWAPISYWLAGNFAFTFTAQPDFRGSDSASKLFWYFNYCIVVTPIICLVIFGIYKLIFRVLMITKK